MPTPTWGTTGNGCSACHSLTIAATGPDTGSHVVHNETDCTKCHNAGTTATKKPSTEHADGFIDTTNVGYPDHKAKGSAYGTCSAASCHANVYGAGSYRPPHGVQRVTRVRQCHSAAIGATGPDTGSHAAHNETDCTKCHNAGTTATTKPSTEHRDRLIDTTNVGYPDHKARGSAYGTCSAVYRHSSGVSVRTGTLSAATTTVWGSGQLACNACHGNSVYAAPNNGMPDYSNGSSKENSHEVHVISGAITCANCHAGTTTNGTSIVNRALHANQVYNLQAGGTFGGMQQFLYLFNCNRPCGRKLRRHLVPRRKQRCLGGALSRARTAMSVHFRSR